MKIKVITGFREDQYYVIDANEAHKAYYLFNNPEKRGVFNNGVALIGKNIQGIEPAYNETMGWNPTHKLDEDDWNEIRQKGLSDKFRDTLYLAKQISYKVEDEPILLNKPLDQIEQLALK